MILWKPGRRPRGGRPRPWLAGLAAGGGLALAARACFHERGQTWSESATLLPVVVGLGLARLGWRAMLRIWPAFAFLIFLYPLPPQVNTALSQPLQSLATRCACSLLRLTGLWVMPEGNVILVGNERLEVAAACNGLSMLMSLAATVAATASLVPMANWKRVVLLPSIIPIALGSNVLRIAATAWCYHRFGAEVGSKYAHDAAGWLMMPTAMVLVGLELAIMSWLIVESEEVGPARRTGSGLERTTSAARHPRAGHERRPAWVWGLPLAPMTRAEAAEAVMRLIEAGRPSFFITANTHYAMLTAERPELRAINDRAAFLLADGAPLVWASRRGPVPLPERVAGSDLVYDLCEHAARLGRRVYLLGGAEGVADEAARRLRRSTRGCRSPGRPARPPARSSGEGCRRLIAEVREARPDLLMVALGQPKGELWLAEHLEELGVPVCVQVGATLDFVAGRVRRAPRLLQKVGMEWAFRIYTDPARLGPRYARNALFLLGQRRPGPGRSAARAARRPGRPGRRRSRPRSETRLMRIDPKDLLLRAALRPMGPARRPVGDGYSVVLADRRWTCRSCSGSPWRGWPPWTLAHCRQILVIPDGWGADGGEGSAARSSGVAATPGSRWSSSGPVARFFVHKMGQGVAAAANCTHWAMIVRGDPAGPGRPRLPPRRRRLLRRRRRASSGSTASAVDRGMAHAGRHRPLRRRSSPRSATRSPGPGS